ncbi:MAG: ATP-binding protein [Oligoflexales bacterium]
MPSNPGGYSKSIWWAKLKIPKEDNIDLLLFDIYGVEQLDLYHLSNNDYSKVGQWGDRFSFADRSFLYRKLAIPITQGEYLLRIDMKTSLRFPIKLTTHQDFFNTSLYEYTMLFTIYGIMIAILIWALVLPVFFRNEQSFGLWWWFVFVLSFLLLNLSIDGLAYQFIWGKYPFIQKPMNIFLLTISYLSLIGTVKYILKVNKNFRAAGRITNFFGSLFLIFLPGIYLLGYQATLKLYFFMGTLLAMWLLFISLLAIRKGISGSKQLSLILLIDNIFIVTYVLSQLGLIPFQFLTANAVKIIFIVQAVPISLTMRNLLELSRRKVESLSQKAMFEKERLKGLTQATQMIAHDVLKPFTLFELYFKLAASGSPLAPSARQEIESSKDHVKSILNEMLFIGQRKEIKLSNSLVNIFELVEEILKVLNVHNSNRIKFVNKLTKIGAIELDEIKIKRVFSNIIDNALHETPIGGSITVDGSISLNQIEISVHNTGSYIPPSEIPKLFKEFYTKKISGNGLGLAICKKFIEVHGGSISCQSSKQDGTVFLIKLPKSRIGNKV